MGPASDAELLELWASASRERPFERASTLLASSGGESRAEIAALTVGQRDARLIELCVAAFGAELAGYAECRSCGEQLELSLDAGELAPTPDGPSEGRLAAEGYDVSFRALTGADVEAAAVAGEFGAARRLLAERAVIEVRREGEQVAASDLPGAVVDELSHALGELDPGAEVLLDLECPACAQRWSAPFDPGGFLWADASARARRLMVEIDALARAYGWSEQDVLAVPPARRSAYLELAR